MSFDYMLPKPLEIESIPIIIYNEIGFLSTFKIYDDSNLVHSSVFKIAISDDFIREIKSSQICTGIMISNMSINNITIYLCVLDDRIFIIKQINIPKFREYFNEHFDLLIFMTTECKEEFKNDLFSNDLICEQIDLLLNKPKSINALIKKEIIRCIIKKSQYRTLKMRHELLPNKFNSRNDDNYKISDFFLIQLQDFKLYYNSKDQILNILKYYEDERRFNHEIEFYHQIENTFPFIRKIFGIIKQTNGLPIVILEYVEGEKLDKFLLSDKEIAFNTKIKIIEEILFSVYYIHSNGYFLRDLKPENVIIDSYNNAILIDFDSAKEMSSKTEDENTGNIGDPVFTAPEQFKSNEYTYKVDLYSVGMIIHFIISREKYNFDNYDLSEIYEKKENISKSNRFPKLSNEYNFILSIYEDCFEISPDSRPSIATLIGKMIIDDDNYNELKRSNEIELPYIINEIEKYESIFKIQAKYIHEDPIERSFLQYFLGCSYFFGKYISFNINKAITELDKASNLNNSYAQFLLGFIYYLDEYISPDINKSIHYLTLSANQNNPEAQYLLGEIYYKEVYIPCDIKKSIHYLTLSADQDNSDAQYLLGEIYYKGEYISRDITKSIHYLTLSADQDNSDAQYLLG